MIAIVSSDARERTAFSALCNSQGWTTTAFESQRLFRKSLRRTLPRVVLMRQKFTDGFSDDVFTALTAAQPNHGTKIIVLVAAGTSSALEARQVSLGADCVLRDPVRTNILVEYLAKYARGTRPGRPSAETSGAMPFAGAVLHPNERALRRGEASVSLTPREVELVELLVEAENKVVAYESLYQEILGRAFRGDTSNMRVLLGKLSASTGNLGITLRDWVEVIPKLGYRYSAPRCKMGRPAASRSPFLTAA